MGSDQPLIEAVASAPPSLVEGDCQPVSTPFATGGHDLELECPSSGVLLESLGPSHSKPLDLQTQDIAELANASGSLNVGNVAGCESGVIPRASVPAVNSWDQAGLVTGLGPNSPVAPSINDFESSENLEVAESDLVVSIPRIASCPAILQQSNQQSAQLYVLSAGCNSAGFNSQTLPHVPSPPFPDPEPMSTLEPSACGLQNGSAPPSSSVIFVVLCCAGWFWFWATFCWSMMFDEHFCSAGLCGGGQTDVPRCQIFTGLLLPPDVAELCCCRFVQFCCSLGPASSKLGVDLAGAV
ncbi:hypothetical protein Nepgr_026633 [Nepenthes gracilis]|uniref:Uncharacterized protein n=1 Tax=Nepenthes gracilis TaxID=150966 RepID=A0AAD3T866_NEPGR|nr:hypothetical protein Nepgr_026633 [Nepenthes gracilis]